MKQTPGKITETIGAEPFAPVECKLGSNKTRLFVAALSLIGVLAFGVEARASSIRPHQLGALAGGSAPASASGILLLLAALFGINKRKRGQTAEEHEEWPADPDGRVTLLQGQCRDLEERLRVLGGNYELVSSKYDSCVDARNAFFEENPIPMLVCDTGSRRFVDANAAAVREYGYSREELLAMTLEDIQCEEGADHGGRNLASDRLRSNVVKHRRKNGTLLESEVLSQAINLNGTAATLLVIRDVSRWRAEVESGEQELYLHKIVMNRIPGRIHAKDREGRFVFANIAAVAGRGAHGAEELKGKTDFDYYPEQVASRLRASEEQAMLSGEEISGLETSEVNERGEQRWSLGTVAPWLDPSGELAGTIGFDRDITERKQIEDQLRLLQFSIEHAGEAVFWIEPDMRFGYVNEAACLMLGYTREELLTMSLPDIDEWFPAAKWPRIFDKMKQGGGSSTFASRHRTKDGRIVPVEVTSNYLGVSGREYSCTFVRDVTKRKETEDALEKSLVELEAIVSAVSEGDLTRRAAEDDSALGRIAQSVNRMLANFSKMVVQVKGLGLTVSSSAAQILAASEEMAAGSERQAEEIASTSNSVEEMATSMTQVARSADNTTAAAQRALVIAKRGDVAVHNALQAMDKIRDSVQATAEKMHTLAQRSSEISELLATIDGIASQANLLSLNAAIEAAHAGESGLGFGVVADEMRKLAERSGQSTKDINGLNRAIQAQTAESLASMDLAMKEVREGSQLAKVAGESIQDLSAVVTESASLIEEISLAAEDQARVSHRIAAAMQTVSGIAAGTSTGTHETSQIMHNMVSIAENLSEAILRFKIGDENGDVGDEKPTQPGGVLKP